MQKIVVHAVEDLIALVPSVLGFVPTESVVVICVRQGVVQMTARMDAEATDAEVAQLLGVVRRQQPESVLTIAYGAAALRTVPLIAATLESWGIASYEVQRTATGWRHLLCRCCPPEGNPLSDDAPAVLAYRVASGQAPAPSRQALAQRLDATATAAEVSALCASLDPVSDENALDQWSALLFGDVPVSGLPHSVLTQAAAAVTAEHRVRDVVLALLCPGTLPVDQLPDPWPKNAHKALRTSWANHQIRHEAPRVTDRLMSVCASLEGRYAVQPLTMLATFAWWTGNGAVAQIALDRALSLDPTCLLAQGIQHALTLGVRPPQDH